MTPLLSTHTNASVDFFTPSAICHSMITRLLLDVFHNFIKFWQLQEKVANISIGLQWDRKYITPSGEKKRGCVACAPKTKVVLEYSVLNRVFSAPCGPAICTVYIETSHEPKTSTHTLKERDTELWSPQWPSQLSAYKIIGTFQISAQTPRYR